MRKGLLLPGLAVIGGVAGAILRNTERNTVFEPDTGLAVLWQPVTVALIALSVVLAALFFVSVRRMRPRTFPGGYAEAFYAPSSLYITLSVAAAFLLAAAGVLLVRDAVAGDTVSVAWLLLGLFALFTAASVLVTARSNFKGGKQGKYSLFLLVPAFFSCFWMVLAYERQAENPVLLQYVYELFAIICILLAFYFMAGFGFEKPKVRRTSFFLLMGIYFSILQMGDGRRLSEKLIDLFAACFFLASAMALNSRSFGRKESLPEAGPEDREDGRKET
ncbi:MAG: hypothetical protein PHT34_00425 [Oscillospiraceae bacterium]|nr:hypothetical protein [Oscillospiraceae bacterium]